jgi:hypothetical protein
MVRGGSGYKDKYCYLPGNAQRPRQRGAQGQCLQKTRQSL